MEIAPSGEDIVLKVFSDGRYRCCTARIGSKNMVHYLDNLSLVEKELVKEPLTSTDRAILCLSARQIGWYTLSDFEQNLKNAPLLNTKRPKSPTSPLEDTSFSTDCNGQLHHPANACPRVRDADGAQAALI